MIFGLAFLNPLLLWALPLAAIPIIIHLLNRRRFQTVQWAAMEYLLLAMKQNRKRMRMEHWLILLLRTLAVILLILLVTRPQFTSSVLGSMRLHHVLLVDDSASTAQRMGAGDTFMAARDAIQELAAKLQLNNKGDLVTVIRSSRPTRPDIAATRVNAGFKNRIRDLVTSWVSSDGILDATALLEEARKQVDANPDADGAEYYFVTDFRRRDWSTEDGKPNTAVNTFCASLEKGREHLSLITVGPKDTENLAITDISCQDRVCVVGQPLTFSIDVSNQGMSPSPAIELAIELDNRSRMMHPVPPLQAGETASIEVSQTFHDPGFHGISATLPDDRYMPDDQRSLAIEVREFSKVLLVDGDPGEELEESETYFLAAAYSVSPGIDARIIADHELATMPDEEFAEFNLIWLCNVARPDEKSVTRLEQFVREGGGLVVTLGNQVDINHYNLTLHKEGKGVLPTSLIETAGDIDAPLSVHLTAEDHELFAKYKEFFGALFARTVLVGRYIELHEDPSSDTKPLLRLEDGEGPAVMVSRSFEQGGTVYMITTSVDALWSNLPTSHTFGMLTSEVHRSSARPQDLSTYNFSPLGKLTTLIDPGIYKSDVLIRARGGDQESWTFTAPSVTGKATPLDVPMSELRGTGLFELVLSTHSHTQEVRLVSRNTLLEEGDLERMTKSNFFRIYPPEIQDRVSIIEGTASASSDEIAGRGSLWHLLAMGLLAGLLLETLLAWRFGRR